MNSRSYLTSYRFRMGLTCPTRLYYEQHTKYPTSQQDQALVNHIRFNKQQLVSLTKGLFPEGRHLSSKKRTDAAEETKQLLDSCDHLVLWDAVLIHNHLYHKIPILTKEEKEINLYEIRTKAINPRKHRFVSKEGRIYRKWFAAFLDLAFARSITETFVGNYTIHTHLILPDKTARAQINYQDFLSMEGGQVTLVNQKALRERQNEINFLSFYNVDREVNKIIEGNSDQLEKHPKWHETDFGEQLQEMEQMIHSSTKYPPLLDMHCRSCPFRVSKDNLGEGERSGFDECWSEQVDDEALQSGNHIFNLIGHGTEKYLRKGCYTLDQISLSEEEKDPEEILNSGSKISYADRQKFQILKSKGKIVPTEFGKPQLFKELKNLSFPLLFLDFEAANMAVPFRVGSKPYESLIFQWSCHLFSKSKDLAHYDWIQDKPDKYPNYAFIRSLLQIPGLHEGTIVQYSPFEKQMVKDVRRIIKSDINGGYAPEDAEELKNELDILLDGDQNQSPVSFLDMNRLVRDYYYHREMNGSLSLKDVIGAVMKTSSSLREQYSKVYKSRNFDKMYWWQRKKGTDQGRDPYDIIEEKGKGISQGAEALMAFIKLQNKNLSDKDRQETVDALLKYCELDTLSMLMLYQHWQEMEKSLILSDNA